jgi:hypothetical protein
MNCFTTFKNCFISLKIFFTTLKKVVLPWQSESDSVEQDLRSGRVFGRNKIAFTQTAIVAEGAHFEGILKKAKNYIITYSF